MKGMDAKKAGKKKPTRTAEEKRKEKHVKKVNVGTLGEH